MTSRLTLLAGADALRIVRERGLSAEDVDVVPAASGGPKWIVLGGIDRVLSTELFARRTRPLHVVGSSIGAWRLACLLQKDPLAALRRFQEAYFDQRYPTRPSPELVTRVSAGILDELLGPAGVDDIVEHPWARLHVITARARGLMASERAGIQMAGMALAAAANAVSRRWLGSFVERVVFHTGADGTPFSDWNELPTRHLPMTRATARTALLASGSIPLALAGVRFPDGPAGVFRDGGVVDYHLDLDFGAGPGIVLYPHFYPYVVPGWFDKALRWRRARARDLSRTVIVAPSPAMIEKLPGRRIPDRNDFYTMSDADRLARWNAALEESALMGEELRDLMRSGRIADRLEPLA